VSGSCPECGSEIGAENAGRTGEAVECPKCGARLTPVEPAQNDETPSELEPPTGSRIVFKLSKDGGAFELPRRGLTPMHLMTIVFAGLWLGASLAFIQVIRSGGWIFLLVSIPFWATGLAILIIVVNSILEKQHVELARGGLLIRLERPLFSRELFFPYGEIDAVALDRVRVEGAMRALKFAGSLGAFNGDALSVLAPSITHGSKTVTFAESVSEKEKRWMVAVIREYVSQKTGRDL